MVRNSSKVRPAESDWSNGVGLVCGMIRGIIDHNLQAGVPPGSRYRKRATNLYPTGAIQETGGTRIDWPKSAHVPPAATSALPIARDPSSRKSPSIHHADPFKSASASWEFSAIWGFTNCQGIAWAPLWADQHPAIQLAHDVQKPQSPS